MPLMPFDPYQWMQRMRQELDRLWEMEPFSRIPASLGGPIQVEVRETPREVIAICRGPGLKHIHDVKAEVRGRMLTIRRDVDTSLEMKGRQVYKKEQFAGRFQRTLPLPASVNARKQRAAASDGYVEFRWPKI